MSSPYVVGLGGGHGLAVTLTAARRYAGQISAVVSVADDGGSSGRLRRDFGMPAPGDVRRCLVALAADPAGPLATAFAHRFDAGDLAGHALGNLVLAALTQTVGSFEQAVSEAGRLLDARGDVFPATSEAVLLTGWTADRRLVGQTAIQASAQPIVAVGIEPRDAAAPAAAVDAIGEADQVIIGPGSLFTSVLAVTAVPAIREALAARAGGVIYVCNLKASAETPGYDAAAHVLALAAHGVEPHVVIVDPAAISAGDMPPGPRVVEAALADGSGWSHAVDKLAGVLGRLARVE